MLLGLLCLVMLLAACQAQLRSGYILTAPRVFLAGEEEKICLSFHNIAQDVSVTFQISKDDTTLYKTKTEIFQGGEGKCIGLEVPNDIPEPQVWFNVSGKTTDGSYSFEDGHKVTITKASIITLIQTDKPIYKPGQLGLFFTKADSIESKIQTLGAQTSWDLFQNSQHDVQVETTQWCGLISLDFFLSEDTVLGTWKITAELDGGKEVQTFKVDEYVLPKFEVKIKPPPFVMVNAQAFSLEVCADYTYGKPVEGVLNLNVCLTNSGSYYRPTPGPPERPCYTERVEIKGCRIFIINADSIHLRFSNYTIHSSKLRIEAEVKETGTGVILNGTHEQDIYRRRLKLAFISTDYYKPGLSYYGRLTVKNPDDTPAGGILINLELTGRGASTLERNLTSNSDGVLDFGFPQMPPSTTRLSLQASAPLYKETHMQRNPIHYLISPIAYQSLKAWYSPSGRFIQIAPLDRTARCEESVNLNVTFTTEGNRRITFYYQVLNLANIVLTGDQDHNVAAGAYLDRVTIGAVGPSGNHREAGTPGPVRDPPGPLGTAGPPGWVPPPTTTTTPVPDPLPFIDTFILKLGINSTMSPKARVLVYYIADDGETVADSIDFEVEQCLQNKVEMSFEADQRKPGDPTSISLTADPDSVCAVTVVDKSVHLLGGNNQLQMSKVFAVLERYDIKIRPYNPFMGDPYCLKKLSDPTRSPPGIPFFGRYEYYSEYYDSEQAFSRVGMLIMTDLDVTTRPCIERLAPVYMMSRRGQQGVMDDVGPAGASGGEIRSYFPETWLWDMFYIGDSGSFKALRDLPDSITEWVGSTFCTNENSGLGVSELAKIKTFKPFFVSFTLPYSVIRNEVVRLPVTVFNYLTECLAVELTMEQRPDYDVADQSQRQVCVCGSESKTEFFQIAMKKLGQVNVSVSAVPVSNSKRICKDENVIMSNRIRKDAVERELLVEPEGREMEYSYSEFFCLENNEKKNATASLELPPSDVVPDSAKGQVSVIGDVMGQNLEGLERLLRMPMGCGEQNMLLFVPNIYVMQYLSITQQLPSQVEARAERFIEMGYQRELKYKHSDGSYSAFGERDPEGSTWLTGFVVKSFAQAQRRYDFIEDKELKNSIAWLGQIQLNSTGCFPQIGRVLHSGMKGGLSSGGSSSTLTAYILIALLETKIPGIETIVQRALGCLDSNSPSDTYTIALMAYAYSLWDPQNDKTRKMIDELETRATRSDGMKHWTKGGSATTPQPPSQGLFAPPYHKATSADVEMSAYALMVYLTQPDGIKQGLPIVKWLSSQRSAHGGFKSTQDTVVALQALAQYASKTYSPNLEATVRVTGQNIDRSFVVNDRNRMKLEAANVQVPNTLHIQASGNGCFLVQANVKYNIFDMKSSAVDAFQLEVTPSTTADNNCKKRSIRVCAKYNGQEDASNMAVVEVKMVSGWVADKESIGKLMNDISLELKKFQIVNKMVNFYFDELKKTEKCFSFTVTQEVEVDKVEPGIAKVYDYYENEKSVSVDYELPACA